MSVTRRHNVNISGSGERTIMFAHGFGCDQTMWEPVARNFEADFRTVLFDYLGHGRSDSSDYSAERYASLDAYAEDVVEIGRALELRGAIFVGHSVSAMIGALASLKAPEMFSDLVMVGPSPRYIDDDGYRGGFSRGQIDELLEFLAANHLGWSAAMAPAIMGNPGPAGARRSAREQLLPHRSRHRPRLRPSDLPLRQSRRPSVGSRPRARPAVQRRHHRAAARGRVRPRRASAERVSAAPRNGALPEPQRAR